MNEKRSEAVALFTQLQVLSSRYQKQWIHNGSNPNAGQGRILSLLKSRPEITQKELTDLTGMTKQAVAQLLEKLEKRAFIVRERSADDRRVSNIKLTKDGVAALHAMDGSPQMRERGKGFDCLSTEELDNFNEYMKRVIKRMEDLVEKKENGGSRDGKNQ